MRPFGESVSRDRLSSGNQKEGRGRRLFGGDRVTATAMAALIWVCLLVVILLVVLPLWGGWAALVVGGISLPAVLLLCFAVLDGWHGR